MIWKNRTSCLLVLGALLLTLPVSATSSKAEINVNIGVNLPPLLFPAPPYVVVIPGTYVYIVPDLEVDILFYQGFWWRPYGGVWYRSSHYKGPWHYWETRRLPRGLSRLPHDYRHRLAPEYRRIPSRDVQRHWKRWERERYWDRRTDRGRGERSEQNKRGRRGGRNRDER